MKMSEETKDFIKECCETVGWEFKTLAFDSVLVIAPDGQKIGLNDMLLPKEVYAWNKIYLPLLVSSACDEKHITISWVQKGWTYSFEKDGNIISSSDIFQDYLAVRCNALAHYFKENR